MGKTTEARTTAKEFAKLIYITEKNATNKLIAARTGISEKTIGKWVKDYKWVAERTSLLTSKSEHIRRLYDILKNVIDQIEAQIKEKGPAAIAMQSTLADMVSKYTAAIRKLENDTNMSDIIDACTQVLAFTQKYYSADLKVVTNILDAFVQSKLN
jgi:hypothetical protein